jgi:hypothetical protein
LVGPMGLRKIGFFQEDRIHSARDCSMRERSKSKEATKPRRAKSTCASADFFDAQSGLSLDCAGRAWDRRPTRNRRPLLAAAVQKTLAIPGTSLAQDATRHEAVFDGSTLGEPSQLFFVTSFFVPAAISSPYASEKA